MSVEIHPTAIVQPGAELGAGVSVGPYSIIGAHVKLGDRCIVGPHVVIEGHSTIGPENQFYQFCSVGAPPQDLKFKGEPATLVMGARNKIREFVTIHVGTAHGTMNTTVGDNNLLMANCHIAHDCRVGNNNIFANSVGLAGHVTIQNNVILGGLCGIHQFVRIGSYAIISAGSMVGLDLPPYCIGQGDRAHVRGVNVIGLERAGMTSEEIGDIRKTYRLLFSSVGHLKDKVAALPAELRQKPRIATMLEFIEGSQRGVLTPVKGAKQDD